MNKNFIYTILGSLLFMFFACDNVDDATSKHIYGEDENPYLKANTEALISTTLKFPISRLSPQSINLKDYAAKFHTLLGLTVDETLEGLIDGNVVFYNINTARGCWNKTPMTKNDTGWYYNTAGGVTDSTNGLVTLDLDKTQKTLSVNVLDGTPVGTAMTFNVGFALNGPDYDNYIRFAFNLTVTDPGRIVVSDVIPEGDYNSFAINFSDHKDAIETCMDMTLKDFSSAVTDSEGPIAMYIIDENGNWDKESNYTANGIGYWVHSSGKVCGWGDDGSTYYIETGEACVNIGRRVAMPAGEVYKMNFVYADKEDNSKYIEFIVTATMQ